MKFVFYLSGLNSHCSFGYFPFRIGNIALIRAQVAEVVGHSELLKKSTPVEGTLSVKGGVSVMFGG